MNASQLTPKRGVRRQRGNVNIYLDIWRRGSGSQQELLYVCIHETVKQVCQERRFSSVRSIFSFVSYSVFVVSLTASITPVRTTRYSRSTKILCYIVILYTGRPTGVGVVDGQVHAKQEDRISSENGTDFTASVNSGGAGGRTRIRDAGSEGGGVGRSVGR